MKLYCDLDGVLVDFLGGAEAMTGEHFDHNQPDGLSKAEKKAIISAELNFWHFLPWTKDGKTLWNSIKKYSPSILTAYADWDTYCIEGKYFWVKENLGLDKNSDRVLVVRRKEKQDYAAPDHILIDDFNSNIKEWKRKGGIGILHINTSDTLEQLEAILTKT